MQWSDKLVSSLTLAELVKEAAAAGEQQDHGAAPPPAGAAQQASSPARGPVAKTGSGSSRRPPRRSSSTSDGDEESSPSPSAFQDAGRLALTVGYYCAGGHRMLASFAPPSVRQPAEMITRFGMPFFAAACAKRYRRCPSLFLSDFGRLALTAGYYYAGSPGHSTLASFAPASVRQPAELITKFGMPLLAPAAVKRASQYYCCCCCCFCCARRNRRSVGGAVGAADQRGAVAAKPKPVSFTLIGDVERNCAAGLEHWNKSLEPFTRVTESRLDQNVRLQHSIFSMERSGEEDTMDPKNPVFVLRKRVRADTSTDLPSAAGGNFVWTLKLMQNDNIDKMLLWSDKLVQALGYNAKNFALSGFETGRRLWALTGRRESRPPGGAQEDVEQDETSRVRYVFLAADPFETVSKNFPEGDASAYFKNGVWRLLHKDVAVAKETRGESLFCSDGSGRERRFSSSAPLTSEESSPGPPSSFARNSPSLLSRLVNTTRQTFSACYHAAAACPRRASRLGVEATDTMRGLGRRRSNIGEEEPVSGGLYKVGSPPNQFQAAEAACGFYVFPSVENISPHVADLQLAEDPSSEQREEFLRKYAEKRVLVEALRLADRSVPEVINSWGLLGADVGRAAFEEAVGTGRTAGTAAGSTPASGEGVGGDVGVRQRRP